MGTRMLAVRLSTPANHRMTAMNDLAAGVRAVQTSRWPVGRRVDRLAECRARTHSVKATYHDGLLQLTTSIAKETSPRKVAVASS
jgi:hypothetical protein